MSLAYSIIGLVNRLGIFMIAAQMIIYFCAKKEYEKHISLLAGLMIVAIFAIAVIGIAQKDFGVDFSKNMAAYEQSLNRATEVFKVESLKTSVDININTSIENDDLKEVENEKEYNKMADIDNVLPILIKKE